MRDEEDVRGERRLKHDWHVGCVEEANRVRTTHTALSLRFHGDLDAEALEVDYSGKNDDGRQEIHDIRQVLAEEGFAEGELLIWPGDEEVDEGEDGAFEFWSAAGIDGRWAEGFPHYTLTHVRSDEEGDTGAETISFLEELVQKNYLTGEKLRSDAGSCGC